MRKSYHAAHIYMILGLVSGFAQRELTQLTHTTGPTPLSLIHGHLLALGMLGFLIVLVLDKQFQLSGTRLFSWFFAVYNAGIAITVGVMAIRGTALVLGWQVPGAASWIAGLGHVLLTVGLILLFVLLGKRIPRTARDQLSGSRA